jgi:hypothetical protein
MVFNRSGVIRSYPPLGFGWWRTDFKGAYGGGVQDHLNYISILQMTVSVGGSSFVGIEDFAAHHVELSSSYHTKHLVSYDWTSDSVTISLKFFLPREHTLSCIVECTNHGVSTRDIAFSATQLYQVGNTKWWGSDGLTARYISKLDAGITKVWAYGDVFVIGSDLGSSSHVSTAESQTWERWVRSVKPASADAASLRGRGPMRTALKYEFSVPAEGTRVALVCLSRGKNENGAVDEFDKGMKEARSVLRRQLKDDEEFWSYCPILAGDWPETWLRGWVYDYETLRMNVRRPLGIFKHPWDAMQVHSPRVVLGETSLDMMTLSYANPSLAKDVIYGTFADALRPNVPCAREDGSVNMISSDGSECGTAPMWGFPFQVIKSIFLATNDMKWIASLYPYLSDYIDWWLQHRTDKEGWLHCNNSWESGQDGSKRFLVAEGNEGAVADFVRTVDVEASMAEAMRNMKFFASILGKNAERDNWERLSQKRIENTRSMFVDGWFRDFDARSRQPIILKDYFDMMMLSPLTCSVATPDQVSAVRPRFQYFLDRPARWLEWPPHLMTFTAAAWNASMYQAGAEAVYGTADRVYARTDAREISFKSREPFSYRIPGVANEFWPLWNIPAGGENYGWGATLPMHILRSIVGFREGDNLTETEFFLAPSLPKAFLQRGKEFGVRNLSYRDLTISLAYRVKDSLGLQVTIDCRSRGPVVLTVVDADGREVPLHQTAGKPSEIMFEAINGNAFVVRVQQDHSRQ